ncbi:MAG: gamma-glutamyl-gamma-aminobutyrate hydrolase family protein [Nitrospirota bacterium]
MHRPVIGITTDIEEQQVQLNLTYCGAVTAAGGIPVLIPAAGDPRDYADRIQGLMIPGGKDLDPAYYGEKALPEVNLVSRIRSDYEIALLGEMTGLCKPVMGICYGMQLINVFFNGSLYQDIGVQLRVAINHKKDYHTVVITENRFLRKGTFSVNSTHHQAIRHLGESLAVFAQSEDEIIEGFYKEDYAFLVGVQWHPERMPDDELSVALFHAFIKASGAFRQVS